MVTNMLMSLTAYYALRMCIEISPFNLKVHTEIYVLKVKMVKEKEIYKKGKKKRKKCKLNYWK